MNFNQSEDHKLFQDDISRDKEKYIQNNKHTHCINKQTEIHMSDIINESNAQVDDFIF